MPHPSLKSHIFLWRMSSTSGLYRTVAAGLQKCCALFRIVFCIWSIIGSKFNGQNDTLRVHVLLHVKEANNVTSVCFMDYVYGIGNG